MAEVQSGRVLLKLQPKLKEMLTEAAEKKGRTLSEHMRIVLGATVKVTDDDKPLVLRTQRGRKPGTKLKK